ncbi:hypothetical protein QBC46DRAFT_428825 [Diplogelasinospora grovesii]|uniref:Rhodopsin domain-containing protein n=1 Tax=Diplogelasinospora grovesii TaxID=303347 RepID=A0AAN6S671_9PEZI|nr:hypothetical protein QBC46DRAFT_428825 [Diplogelasinospora grovesii]
MSTGTGPYPLPPDENAAPALLISSSILIAFVVITTGLRLYVRGRNHSLGWDDYTITGGMRSCCSSLASNDRWLRNLLYGAMAGLVVTNGGVIVILLAECSPVEAYWRGNGVCWDSRVRIYSIYFTIGTPKVRIPPRTKVLVCGLMSLGLLATGFGVARASSLGLTTSDLTWAYAIAAIWSNSELFLGIIAANLALSRSVHVHFFGKSGRRAESSRQPSSARSATMQAVLLRDDQLERQQTVATFDARRPSGAKSDDNSEQFSELAIQKKTEFWLSEEKERAKE